MDTGDTNQQLPDAQAELSQQTLLNEQNDRVYLNMHVHARSLVGRLGDYTDPEEDSKLWSFEDYSRRQSELPQTNNAEANLSFGTPGSRNESTTMDVGNGSTELTFVQMIGRQSILSSLLNDHVLVLQHVPHPDDPDKAYVCGLFGCMSVKPDVYRLNLKAADSPVEISMVYDKDLFCLMCIEMLFGKTVSESVPGLESEE